MMVFSGLEFLFRFLPIFLAVYYVTPARYRNAILFLGSMFFYATGEPRFVILLLALTVANYLLGNLFFRKKKKRYLACGVLLDLAALLLCKALALTVDESFLPIGLSFYVFKMISYQADLYRGDIENRPSFWKAAAYFTMFPQVTQGPIMRYGAGKFDEREPRRCSLTRFEDGLVFLTLGLSMKVLLADRIGILWNEIAKIGYESISTPLAWMGAFGYTFQLYFDFWGYSLMAAGVGLMLGFPFVLNFDHPYTAVGVADFYRRWHVTLGAWFRDYLYIPMGGSRKGILRTIVNLMVVWAVTGLWHGGTVNFLLWGLLLGLVIVWEKTALRRLMDRVPLIGRLHVWILIPLTWVIFAISDLEELRMYFTRLFPFFGTGVAVNQTDFLRYLGTYWPLFLAAAALCHPALYRGIVRTRKKAPTLLLLTALFWVSMYFAANSAGNVFMYFSF
ncbi:MAG: MBOAT family O-acyltransferase [Eubacteriales bacterium]|nr:MBOAT family O-acyltransferase [Eubacteriales bacterium]